MKFGGGINFSITVMPLTWTNNSDSDVIVGVLTMYNESIPHLISEFHSDSKITKTFVCSYSFICSQYIFPFSITFFNFRMMKYFKLGIGTNIRILFYSNSFEELLEYLLVKYLIFICKSRGKFEKCLLYASLLLNSLKSIKYLKNSKSFFIELFKVSKLSFSLLLT